MVIPQKASLTITDNNRKVIILIVDDLFSSTVFPEKTIIRRLVVTRHARIQKVLSDGSNSDVFILVDERISIPYKCH